MLKAIGHYKPRSLDDFHVNVPCHILFARNRLQKVFSSNFAMTRLAYWILRMTIDISISKKQQGYCRDLIFHKQSYGKAFPAARNLLNEIVAFENQVQNTSLPKKDIQKKATVLRNEYKKLLAIVSDYYDIEVERLKTFKNGEGLGKKFEERFPTPVWGNASLANDKLQVSNVVDKLGSVTIELSENKEFTLGKY
jgi:hypothetical protein